MSEETKEKPEAKIAYEPHPVTPERKKELREQGYKILDERFAPDYEERLAKKAKSAKSTGAKG